MLSDPGLHAVFFGFIAESVTDASLRSTIAEMRGVYRDLIARLIADSRGQSRITKEIESTATLVLATMAGLTIEFLERGDTPALRRAFAQFKEGVANLSEGTRNRGARPARGSPRRARRPAAGEARSHRLVLG